VSRKVRVSSGYKVLDDVRERIHFDLGVRTEAKGLLALRCQEVVAERVDEHAVLNRAAEPDGWFPNVIFHEKDHPEKKYAHMTIVGSATKAAAASSEKSAGKIIRRRKRNGEVRIFKTCILAAVLVAKWAPTAYADDKLTLLGSASFTTNYEFRGVSNSSNKRWLGTIFSCSYHSEPITPLMLGEKPFQILLLKV
jgi:hypothetical protein